VLRAVLAAVAVVLVFPVSAQAALSFAFDRAQARVGQRVHAYQADVDGNPIAAWWEGDPAQVTIYLVRVRDPAHWRRRLGPMAIDERGVWSIDFRVPKVKPGLYTTAFYCRPCGNTFFPSTVTGSPWTGKPGRVLKVRR
jgi:hypothetical protein